MSTADSSPTNPTIVIQQKESMFGRYGKFLIAALVFAIMVIIGMQAAYHSYFNSAGGPQEKYFAGSKTATDKVAIITVAGTISEADTFVMEQIDRVKADENVVAVVLRINSPGGTVTYSDYLHHKLRELATGESREGTAKGKPLPIVVSMGSICASGGYYLASAVGDTENSIFAEPATITGSIGVIIPHYDLSGLLKDWNVSDDSIMSNPLKDLGSLTKPMTDEERKILQTLVDDMLASFKDKIKEGRPMYRDNPADLDAIATGQIFTAQQAKELKLIDDIGYVEDALARAAELAGKDPKLEDVRCVEYNTPPGAFDAILGVAHKPSTQLDLSALSEVAAPKAYYLHGWVPGMLEEK